MSGGLGNQLFQYAHGRKLQIEYGEDVEFMFELPQNRNEEVRNLSIRDFNISNKWKYTEKYDYFQSHKLQFVVYKVFNRIWKLDRDDNFSVVTDKYKRRINFLAGLGIYIHSNHIYFETSRKSILPDKYVEGLWHSPIYFDSIRDILKKEISFVERTKLPKDTIEQINTSQSVCIHVRRGDYLNYSDYIVCDENYYISAMNIIRKRVPGCRFFVFSDDMDWVKVHLNGEDVDYMPMNNTDTIDFEVMKTCKHFIISNSTYSWWAAYLGEYEKKIVITPDRWYNDGKNKEWLNLKDWIVNETLCIE